MNLDKFIKSYQIKSIIKGCHTYDPNILKITMTIRVTHSLKILTHSTRVMDKIISYQSINIIESINYHQQLMIHEYLFCAQLQHHQAYINLFHPLRESISALNCSSGCTSQQLASHSCHVKSTSKMHRWLACLLEWLTNAMMLDINQVKQRRAMREIE